MSCTEFQNNIVLKVQTLHLQFFCSCLNESFNRCSSRFLSGGEVSKSLSKLTQKFLKVVDKWWWVQIIPIFFPLEKWRTDFICIRMWLLQEPGTTLNKNCFSLLQYQKTRQLFVSWHILESVCNRCEEHKRRSNRNDWSVYSVGWEKWTSEGELTNSGLWFNLNYCINIVGLTEQLW
jgi:hypothetical protein